MNHIETMNELVEAHINLLLEKLREGDTSVLKESREFLKQYEVNLPTSELVQGLKGYSEMHNDIPYPISGKKTGS